MKTKTKKIIGTSALAVVAAAVLTTGIYMVWLRIPPAMPENLDDAALVLSSSRFQRLPADRKLAYAERMRELAMDADEAERRAFWDQARGNEELRQEMRDIMREQLIQRARQYALATEAERDQMIFQMMADFQQMRGQWRQNRENQNEQSPREEMTEKERAERRAERRERMVDSMEHTAATGNPQDQQLVVEMFQSIRQKFGGMRGGNRGE